MKKCHLFLALLLLTAFSAFSQTPKAVGLNESFNGMSLPGGWSLVDSLTDSHTWEFVEYYPVSYSLDGTPFALVNSDANTGIYMSEQLVSPVVDVSSYSAVIVEFDQYFNYFGGGGTERASVDVWNGSVWTTIYSTVADAGTWGTPDHQSIDATAYKNAGFKVRFRYYGAYNDYWWAVDNIKVWDPQPNDVGTPSLAAPVSGFGMSVEQISVVVKNFGTVAQTSIPVSYQVDGGSIENETLDNTVAGFTTLAPGAEFTYTFSATYDFSAIQMYNVKTWTGLGTDTDHANDTMNTAVSNSPALVQNTFGSLLNGTFGVETDGNYYYVSFWTTPGKFGRYSMSGAFVDTFRIPALSVGIRDMAWDPATGHFFGGAATPVMYELDLDSVVPTLVGQVSTPSGASVRYIACDHNRNGFWVGNLTGDIFLIDKTGALMTAAGVTNPILNASLTGLGNRYGLAYDDWSCPGEYLWVFCQPTTPSNVYLAEVDIATGLPTGNSLDLSTQLTFTGATPAAAGLFTHPNLVAGTATVGGLITGAGTGTNPNMIFLVDLEGVHPDQPMVIDEVFPANGATQVQLDHTVMMMIPETFVINNTSSIEILDGATPLTINSVTVSGDTIKISHVPFQGETTYTVNFPAGTLTGLCSDNLLYSWSFTTGAVGFDEQDGREIVLYPNPAGSSFIVSGAENADLKIFSSTGICVHYSKVESAMQSIGIDDLSAGVYIVEITAGSWRSVKKLVVE